MIPISPAAGHMPYVREVVHICNNRNVESFNSSVFKDMEFVVFVVSRFHGNTALQRTEYYPQIVRNDVAHLQLRRKISARCPTGPS